MYRYNVHINKCVFGFLLLVRLLSVSLAEPPPGNPRWVKEKENVPLLQHLWGGAVAAYHIYLPFNIG